MKKHLSLVFVSLFAILFSASFAFAQDTTTPPADNGYGQQVQAIKQEMKTVTDTAKADIQKARMAAQQKMEALKATLKKGKSTAMTQIKQLRLSNREEALTRFDAAVTRISNIESNVNAEIAKLDATGINTTDAKNFVATAETKLTSAQSDIAQINTLLAGTTNQLSAANKTKLQTLAKDTQTLLVDARQALNDAVKSLKEAAKVQTTPTTDPAPTENNQ